MSGEMKSWRKEKFEKAMERTGKTRRDMLFSLLTTHGPLNNDEVLSTNSIRNSVRVASEISLM